MAAAGRGKKCRGAEWVAEKVTGVVDERLCFFVPRQSRNPGDEIFEGTAAAMAQLLQLPSLKTTWRELAHQIDPAVPMARALQETRLLQAASTSVVVLQEDGTFIPQGERPRDRVIFIFHDFLLAKPRWRLLTYVPPAGHRILIWEVRDLPASLTTTRRAEGKLPAPESTPLMKAILRVVHSHTDEETIEAMHTLRPLAAAQLETKKPFVWTTDPEVPLGAPELMILTTPGKWLNEAIVTHALHHALTGSTTVTAFESPNLALLTGGGGRAVTSFQKQLAKIRKSGRMSAAVLMAENINGNHWVGRLFRRDQTYLYFDSYQKTDPHWSPQFIEHVIPLVETKLRIPLQTKWRKIDYRLAAEFHQKDCSECGVFLSKWFRHIMLNDRWQHYQGEQDRYFEFGPPVLERAALIRRFAATWL